MKRNIMFQNASDSQPLPLLTGWQRPAPRASHASSSFRLEVALIFFVCITFLSMVGSLFHHDVDAMGGAGGYASTDTSLTRKLNDPPPSSPHLPFPLPIFSPIPNADRLIAETQSGKKPTLAGVTAIFQSFLSALHDKNAGLSNHKSTVRTVIDNYFDLVSQYLLPLEAAYRGRPIFPIREDNSIFMSLCAYREHLLYDTLKHAFVQALHPEKLFIGVVVQNCFGKVRHDGTIDTSGTPCKTGRKTVGKNAKGKPTSKVLDAPIDVNGIDDFCSDKNFKIYCESGQIRVLYVHETESLGPAFARYFASKLWGGETYFIQIDSHLQFTQYWDDKYIKEAKAAKSYPKVVLSAYPRGFLKGLEEKPGTRLCTCLTQGNEEIIRITTMHTYKGGEEFPAQIPFVAAGFFFTRAEFLVDVPFDPYLPWVFIGEEIALSIRTWTAGWDIYAPRINLIAHEYRPGNMGLPKFWGAVNRLHSSSGFGNNALEKIVLRRIMNLVGYPQAQRMMMNETIFRDIENYGLGAERSLEEYMKFAGITVVDDKLECTRQRWCGQGTVL